MKLTKKMQAMNVTIEDVKQAKEIGLLNNYTYFKAWASGLKKGQYNISELLEKEGIHRFHKNEMESYFIGLAINYPEILQKYLPLT